MYSDEDLQSLFDQGLHMHQQGDLVGARRWYKKLLIVLPCVPDFLGLFGAALTQDALHIEAITYLRRALYVNPLFFPAHLNLGNALRDTNLLAESVGAYKIALAINPSFGDAYRNLGMSLAKLESFEESKKKLAVALRIDPQNPEVAVVFGKTLKTMSFLKESLSVLIRSLSMDPAYAEAHLNQGLVLEEIDQLEDSLHSYRRAIISRLDNPEAHVSYGKAISHLKRYDASLECFERVIALRPDQAGHYVNRGSILQELGRFKEALATHNRAIQIQEDLPGAHMAHGIALMQLERLDEAINSHKRALALNESFAECWMSSGILLRELGRYSEALDCLERAISIDPEYGDAYFNKSLIKLSQGEFKEGWALYKWRWKVKSLQLEKPPLAHKAWDGNESGIKLWLWPEQGIGDQILFGSALQSVSLPADDIVVSLDPRLVPLFKRSFPQITFSPEKTLPPEQYDRHLPLGDLPGIFQASVSEPRISKKTGFLVSDKNRSSFLRDSLSPHGDLICGISWQSVRKDIGKSKSADLLSFSPLLRMRGVTFVNLQYGDVAEQLAFMKSKYGLHIRQCDSVDNFSDLDGLAALIDACDFVVTTSNSTAHLAGALGKETHVLAPSGGKALLWYWGTNQEERSLWYPSVKIYRQNLRHNWDLPMSKIIQEIKKQWGQS